MDALKMRQRSVLLSLVVSLGAGGTAYADLTDPVPVNIVFLVDASSSMAECLSGDERDADADGTIDTCLSTSKLEAVKSALADVAGSIGNAYIALAQTDPSTTSNGLGTTGARDGVMVPLGATLTRFSAGLSSLALNPDDENASSEALDDLREYYQGGSHCTDATLCGSSPIQFYCQKNYIIYLTDGTSQGAVDFLVTPAVGTYSASPNITVTWSAAMDNVASYMANVDLSASLSNSAGSQHVFTHVIGLDITRANDTLLFASTGVNGSGSYSDVDTLDKLKGELWTILTEIMDGSYYEAPPVLTATADYLLVGYYDVRPDRPLYYGQYLGFQIETDTHGYGNGTIIYDSGSPWDAGSILESRSVTAAEWQETSNGNNGEGKRDIFTNIDLDGFPDAFDGSNIERLCPLMFDLSIPSGSSTLYPGVPKGQDIDGDGDVDEDDCQELIDFIRGYPLAEFKSNGDTRGNWKLGSIRHSTPVVAEPDPPIFTRNPYLRKFLTDYLAQTLLVCPNPGKGSDSCEARVSYVAGNDGMIHAFSVTTGDELWAYIPRNLLGEVVSASDEKSELLDLMWSEKVIMDASPSIGFVWIDGYEGAGVVGTADGKQSETEWLRVLLIGQASGGRYYTALDITQPDSPYILWEDAPDDGLTTAMGASTSSAQVALIRHDDHDDWVAFYGSGQEETENLKSRLYIRAMKDVQGASLTYDKKGVEVTVDLDADSSHDNTGFPSNPTIVDRDNDGDADEVFLVNSKGVMYKFVMDATDPDDTEGCLFFDPQVADLDDGTTDQYIGKRTASYYSATAAVTNVGEILLYFGTGSPYDIFTTDRGYVYVIRDYPGCTEGKLYTDCDGTGYLALEEGEKLTASPVVFSSVLYFTTWQPNSDRCVEGEARLYAVSYEECSAVMDTDNSGTAGDGGDDISTSLGSGLPSGVVVANGTIYVATTNTGSGSGVDIETMSAANDTFGGTTAIQWREMF